ncbi:CotH kinase family protein [Limosilactobacillus reuteri subsp. suis]|uniref:CotH kinase family protein n=1 Tax=Limosilactobacillus reuteri TaxID=1598 RepID=UPI0039938D78
MAKEISNLITFNTYKFERGGLLVDMFNQFNARVGDQGTELAIQWETSKTETKINLKERELHFFAAGSVGQYLEKLEDGTGFKMSADASTVEWEDKDGAGSLDDGITVAKLPKQFFPQKGIFFGYFGLKDRQGNIFTSVNVWFRVLGGVPTMGAAIPYFVTEFDEVLERCNGKIVDALAELREKYQAEVKKNEDMSAETRAALSKLADSVGAVQAQIDAGNVITRAEFKELDDRISAKLSTMRLNPEAFANEAALRAKYPQGNDQLNVTIDNGHLWVWIDGDFKDCGPFQTAGIDQKLVDQIKEALAFANGDNFIANGSFTTGNVEPAMTTNDDTKLAITDYLGQKWLQITAVGNSSMRGAQWVIDSADKIAAIQNYPLNINFDIQSSVAQTFNIDIHFLNNNGQDMNNAINIDQLRLNPWELLHYKKTIDLNISSLSGVAKIVIMVYSNNTGDYGTVLITKLIVGVKYNTNKLPGPNLLQGKPWTANNDSIIGKTTYLGEEWYKLTSLVNSSGRGYQWIVDDADKVSLLMNYPLNLAFNLDALTVSQLFNLDVHFYDKNGNDLGNSYTIDSIQANAGDLIHYEKQLTFDFNHLQNATKIALLLYSTSSEEIGTVLLNHQSALLQFKTNQLKGPSLLDGQPFVNNSDTVISTVKYLEQEWLQMTSTANTKFRGLQWQIDNKDKIFLMATYPVRFQFNIQSSIAQTLNLDLHFYDKNGNDLGNSINVDQIALNAWELLNYQKEFLVDFEHIKDAAKVVLMLYTSGTNDLGIVLINDYNAVLEYNTNKKSNSASSHDYKQLPEVYLNGSTSGMSGNNYVTMQFKFKNNGREVDGFASTKWQGDSSLAFDKKAYRIKTFEDQSLTKQMKFKPCPLWYTDNKYNLKAYYTDPLLCRDVVNANIGADIWATQKGVPDDLVETDDFGFIDGFPVKVFVNNEFAGIYSFNTAKGDYGKHAKAVISGKTYTASTAFSALPDGGVKLDGSDFEMISPDEPTDEIKQATNDLITFVSTSSDDDFKAQLSQHIDLESLIDYFIFLNVIENGDAAGKNQTLITWDLKKWYFHPYDLDTTYGVDSNGKISEPVTGLLGLNSHLFTRLNELFIDQIKTRYKELRTWLTPVHVLKMYRDHINSIGEANYEDEFKLWDNPNHDKNTYNFLKTHIYKRFQILDGVWGK